MWILGSSSPRRAEILGAFSLPFTVIKPPFDELSVPFEGCPETYVKSIAKGKALSLDYPEQPLLTADTIVFKEGKVYGKAENLHQAQQFLQELSGCSHQVFSAICVCYKGESTLFCEQSRVFFHDLSKKQIAIYLQNFKWQDKAGAYMAQLPGGFIVKKIEGCFYNVMGLPLNALEKALLVAGASLWPGA